MIERLKKSFLWFSITIFFIFAVYTSIKVIELPPSYGNTVSSLAIESLLKFKEQFSTILSIIFYLRFFDIVFIFLTGLILILTFIEKKNINITKYLLRVIKKRGSR